MMTSVLNALSVTVLADELSLRQRTDRIVQPYLDNGVFVGCQSACWIEVSSRPLAMAG